VTRLIFRPGDKIMWTVALCCAALGVLLSVRFRAFALVPASVCVLGLTLFIGVLNGWGPWGLALVTIANLIALQLCYCVGAIASTRFSEPVERRPMTLPRTQPNH
jgi:hypothetical protein